MTKQEKKLVQRSWRLLRDIDPVKLGDLFYSKLFFDHPEVRPMFPKDMEGQKTKLIHILNVVIARLDYIEDIESEIVALGKRHIEYGVLPRHYEYVATALLWTLARSLGDDWTPEVESAWVSCYTMLAETMMHPELNIQMPPDL